MVPLKRIMDATQTATKQEKTTTAWEGYIAFLYMEPADQAKFAQYSFGHNQYSKTLAESRSMKTS